MKKLLGLLSIAILLFASACSSTNENQKNVDTPDEIVSTEKTENGTENEEMVDNTVAEDTKKKVEYAKVDVSTDLNAFEFGINGEKFTLPCVAKDLQAAAKTRVTGSTTITLNGKTTHSALDIDDFTLDPFTDTAYHFITHEDSKCYPFKAMGLNKTDNPLLASECFIYEVWQDWDKVTGKDFAPIIYFPGNIHVGMNITVDELTELLGEPSYFDEEAFTYEDITYSEVEWYTETYNFSIHLAGDTISHIDYRNEVEANLVVD